MLFQLLKTDINRGIFVVGIIMLLQTVVSGGWRIHDDNEVHMTQIEMTKQHYTRLMLRRLECISRKSTKSLKKWFKKILNLKSNS